MNACGLRWLAAGAAAVLSSGALAQDLLVPLEQRRSLEITVGARSGETEAVYVFSSEPEALEPFFAFIDGELLVDTASARGTGSHLSEIHGSGVTVQQEGIVVAWAPGLLDEASARYHASTEVDFEVDKHVRFDVFGLSADRFDDAAEITIEILDAAGASLWSLPADRREVSFAAMGELKPGTYTFRVATLIHADAAAGSGVWAAGQISAVLMLSPGEACPCDWNMDAFLDTADLFQFLNDFFDNNADFDHSGSTDSADFFAFLGCILNGCG